MLNENTEREKITLTIKKSNKEILERLAELENRNISRQVDQMIERYVAEAEQKLVDILNDSMRRTEEGAKCYTSEEMFAELGIRK